MTLIVADRVKETTTSTGTGAVTLAGAVSGYQAFSSVCATNDTVPYVIEGGAEWETGIGTYTLSGTTLARTTVIASSNANAAVNFSAGSKNVFISGLARYAIPVLNSYDIPPATRNAADDEWTEAALDTGGTRFSGATAWAWSNQGSATATVAGNRRILLKDPSNGATSIRSIEQSLPGSGAWTYVVSLNAATVQTAFQSIGMMLRESSTGKYLVLVLTQNAGVIQVQVNAYTNTSTFGSQPGAIVVGPLPVVYFKIDYDGSTNLTLSYSFDGVTFIALVSGRSKTSDFTTAPDKIGLTIYSNQSSKDTYGLFGPFRRTA